MQEHKKKAFDFAADTTKQLITISTAIITLSVTFSKDIIGANTNYPKNLLIGTWICFVLSIISGILTMMALTGTLHPMANKKKNDDKEECKLDDISINKGNIRFFSAIQALLFVAAIVLTGFLGYKSLAPNTSGHDDYTVIRRSFLNNDTIPYIDTLYLPKNKTK